MLPCTSLASLQYTGTEGSTELYSWMPPCTFLTSSNPHSPTRYCGGTGQQQQQLNSPGRLAAALLLISNLPAVVPNADDQDEIALCSTQKKPCLLCANLSPPRCTHTGHLRALCSVPTTHSAMPLLSLPLTLSRSWLPTLAIGMRSVPTTHPAMPVFPHC